MEPGRPASRLREYDEATGRLLMECFQRLCAAQDPLLGMLSRAPTDAIPSTSVEPGITYGAYRPLNMEMRFVLSRDAVLSTNVEEWAAAVQDSVDQGLPDVMGKVFGALDEILTEAGQVVDGQGEPLSVAWVLKSLEKIRIDFDDQGNPKLPTLVAHPDVRKRLAETALTPEEQKQFVELIERKRQEFYARRRVRKLD